MNVNLEILNDYSSTDGKTQAFYGLIELKYLYKYYFINNLIVINSISIFCI